MGAERNEPSSLPVPPGGERQEWRPRSNVMDPNDPESAVIVPREDFDKLCALASSVPVGEPDPDFGGLTRDEVQAVLAASEGMAVLPVGGAPRDEIAERTRLDPDRVRDVLDASRDDQNDDVETLRGAAIEALDALEGYLQGEAGLPFVEAYGAARKAAEYLRVGLAAAETRERSASASTKPSSGAAPKGEQEKVDESSVSWQNGYNVGFEHAKVASPPPDRLTDLEHEATRAAFHLREATGLIDTDDVAAWKHVQMAYDRLRLAGRELED